MGLWDIVPAAVAVGWSTLTVNLAVLPFYAAREKWHKDYVDSGSLAQAEAFIDSEKLIPSLAEIIDLVIAERKPKSKVTTSELLESVDFLPALAKAESAAREKAKLSEDLKKLESIAKRLWRWGLAHVGGTIAVWTVFATLFVSPQSPVQSVTQPLAFWFAVIAAGALFMLSGVRVCWNFYTYDKRRDAFLECLRTNK
jgi:hypothetical protein